MNKNISNDVPNDVLEILGVEKYTPILSAKKLKILVTSLMGLLIILICIFVNLKSEYNNSPIQVNFASGLLSESIFDSQNTNLVDNYTIHASFNNIDFIVGVPSASTAEVDSGQAFQINDDYVAFISEFKSDIDISSLLIAQLGKIYLLNVDEAKCSVQPYIRESGYINGYAAEYRADAMYITDNVSENVVYIEGYVIKISNNYSVYISTASMEAGKKAFEIMRNEAKNMVYTLRFSQELADERKKASEEVQSQIVLGTDTTADDTKISNFVKGSISTDSGISTTESTSNEVAGNQQETIRSNDTQVTQESGIKTNSLMISPQVDYLSSTVEVTYTETTANITNMVITDLDGNKIASGDVKTPGTIVFENADYKKGSYLIVIMSESDIGDCSSKFLE